MNTKERLKEQRQAGGRTGWLIGIGMGIGLSIGFSTNFVSGANTLTPEWAIYLIAYCLGVASVFVIWWLRGYETPPTRKKESV
ncbi:MAG: hypothetical protein J7J98_01025 [candidate division Zixibacteria bacterium]|nr:hypothetical protein [candidate division Zixibacteria bacterium]